MTSLLFPNASYGFSTTPLSKEEVAQYTKLWNAINYLTVGQIYLKDNVLLRQPLIPDNVKPRLLGHWGTSPGLSLLWIHWSRLIKKYNLPNNIYVAGPGHGGPAIVACTYLEDEYTRLYPNITQDEEGIKKLFRSFSTPGGIPSHVSPNVPGSLHEGGELGYSLSHAFGAAFDNPDAFVICVVGDGEAETGPLAAGWQGLHFLNPRNDGAVLPVLHLNGYKIANPTVLGRTDPETLKELFSGYGFAPMWVSGEDTDSVQQQLASAYEKAYADIRAIQKVWREAYPKVPDTSSLPKWPMIIFHTPKGWTGPKVVDGKPVENTWRSHQVPMSEVKSSPDHMNILDKWLRSYHPEENFDASGKLIPELRALLPEGQGRMSANPVTNGGGYLHKNLVLNALEEYAVDIKTPAQDRVESTTRMGRFMRDIYKNNPTNFRIFCPDETNSNRLGACFEVENRCFGNNGTATIDIDDKISPYGRVMEVLSEHNTEGWLEGYTLTGRHGLWASYEAFTMIISSMVAQHTKWLQTIKELSWRADVPSLNLLLTSTCWRNDHNGFSHQGPGFMDTVLSKQGEVTRIYLPCDANTLLVCAEHVFKSKNYINLLIIDKQPQLQYLSLDQAREHCKVGGGIWSWASNEFKTPDIIFACAGDYMTQEILAASELFRDMAPSVSFRVVNIVDILTLYAPDRHPHGMSEERFRHLFGEDNHVIFAFHGYKGAIHTLIHCRPKTARFHVRGYSENGTTTTPFDMLVLNGVSRYQLVKDAAKRTAEGLGANITPETTAQLKELVDFADKQLARHHSYIREHFEDIPEINNWKWSPKKN